MKINPVVGTPTISNGISTGVSQDRLAKAKSIAAGTELTNPGESEEAKKKLASELNRIKMNVSRTPEPQPQQEFQNTEGAPAPEEAPAAEPSAISDTDVQANVGAEATAPLSPQFAALAKQRRALQVKERELAQRMKALEGPTRADLEAKLKSQPLSVLQEYGVTYDKLTEDLLAAQNGISPEIAALKADIKALQEGVDKKLSEKDTAAEQAVLSEMRRNVNRLAKEGDDFALIRETGSESEVVDLIHRTWKESGEILDEAEAAGLVEEYLLNESLKLAKLNKVQGKLTPKAPLQQQSDPSVMKTLTNKDSATPGVSRRQRAILAMQGHLKR